MTDLSLIDIAITAMLRTAFPDIPVIAEEVREEIVRPAFKVLFGEITTSADSVNFWQRRIPVEIVYFAKNTADPKPECYTMARKLAALLLREKIVVADGTEERAVFPVGEIRHGIGLGRSDALLYVHFELDEQNAADEFEDESAAAAETMENLNMNLEVT